MNQNVEHPLLEHLRAIRGDMGKMADVMRTMQVEMTSIRQHLAGVVTIQEHDHSDIASMNMPLDRIECRLDIAE